ncbi:hypothetical protein LCGC14_0782670 [marine sediment metagenome]|uniref:Uncharacterized protein n=1 Tax=marine sediment metagenome TaxID=412755 RepID=A0A0F9T215_9ZZZZ
MGFQVEDGRGRGYQAEVNSEQELVVRAIVETELEHSSASGTAYSWDSTELDIDTGDTMLFVKNTGDVPLILDRAEFNGSNVICTWTILTGEATTTAAGTVVTGVNQNRSFSSKLADATAFSDETAVADGDIVSRVKTAVSGHHVHNLDGLILGKNHYLQINQITESTSGSVIVIGHFETPS